MPGAWTHLAARFYDFMTASRLARSERDTVRRWLGEEAACEAFFAQPDADQRHGLHAALHVMAESPSRLDLIRAALLHDIGKRHARLGAVGRVIASIAIRLRLPLTPRLALYRDHGPVAAGELAGLEPLVVEFARHHHSARPASIPAPDWELLVGADRARTHR